MFFALCSLISDLLLLVVLALCTSYINVYMVSKTRKVALVCVVYAEGSAAGGAAYVRYVVPTPDDEEATVEYDLDEEDEEWLQQHNHKVLQVLPTHRVCSWMVLCKTSHNHTVTATALFMCDRASAVCRLLTLPSVSLP